MALSTHSDGTEGSESADDGYRHHQMPVEDIKEEWRLLWLSRIDDKVRAEGIANRDYSLLFVEQGTVIVATRDFKPVSLKEILFLHKIRDVERVIPPPSSFCRWMGKVRSHRAEQAETCPKIEEACTASKSQEEFAGQEGR